MARRFLWLVLAVLSLEVLSLSTAMAQTFPLKPAPGPVDNPLKGLVPYADPARGRFPHSMEFSYLGLGQLVVGDAEYDFSDLETLLDQVKSRGNQTVFRIMLEYPGKTDLIPKYLIDKGLVVHKYKNTNTAPFPPQDVETPDYENLELRKCMQDFVVEMGRRYDGDPRIAYITAGLLGTWGEWHTYPRNELWASKQVQQEVLNAYAKAFTKTPVLLRYPAGEDHYDKAPTYNLPFGYHDDSFAFATMPTGKAEDNWFFGPAMQKAGAMEVWKRHPIGGEIRPEVWGCCFDAQPCTPAGQSFGACRDFTHATWLLDTGMFREQASADRLRRAKEEVRKMGYEFYVSSATLRKTKSDSKGMIHLSLDLNIENQGIAPFYHPGWPLYLALIDPANNQVVKKWSTDTTLQGILPGRSQSRTITIETDIEVGTERFILAVGVPNPMEGGKPLRFANEHQDLHATGWLSLVP
jgi:hypothetical protein